MKKVATYTYVQLLIEGLLAWSACSVWKNLLSQVLLASLESHFFARVHCCVHLWIAKFQNIHICMSRVPLIPCFFEILAGTTFVHESLTQAKNPHKDAIFWDLVFKSKLVVFLTLQPMFFLHFRPLRTFLIFNKKLTETPLIDHHVSISCWS